MGAEVGNKKLMELPNQNSCRAPAGQTGGGGG